MIAALQMYDWPEVQGRTDAFWIRVRAGLEEAGIDAPVALSRPEDLHSPWTRPDLVLGQTCGLPLVLGLTGDATVLGRGIYVEVKVPKDPGERIETLRIGDVPQKSGKWYYSQCQTHILCGGEPGFDSVCHFVSFDPRIPKGDRRRLAIIPVARDEDHVSQLIQRAKLGYQLLDEWRTQIDSSISRREVERHLALMTAADRERVLASIQDKGE